LLRDQASSLRLRQIVALSPRIPRHAFACIAARDIGKFAFEGAGEREAVGPFALDGSCGERGIAGLRRAARDEGGTGSAWKVA